MLHVIRSTEDAGSPRILGVASARRFICTVVALGLSGNAVAQEPAHPSLLFNKSDIAELRRAVKSGWMRDAFRIMESRANEFMAVPVNPYKFEGAKTLGRRLNARICNLALTGILTGDRRYCDHAVDMVVSAAKTTDVDLFVARNHHLSVGDGAQAYSMAYDWLWEYMSEDERELLRDEIRSFGKWLYDYSMEGRGYGRFEPQNLSCNHNSVTHGGLGLCSLVLGENPEWTERAKKFVRGYLQYSCDETGYSYEGVGYFAYGFWGAVPFGVAVKRADQGDIFNGIKTLPMIPEYILRQVVPWGHEVVSMNDSNNRIGSSGGLMYLISRFQDRVGLWAWLKLYGNDGDSSFGAHPNGYLGDGASIPYTLLFADHTLKPLSPEKADVPLCKHFESGRASFRSGWDDLAALATFTCGFDRHRGHNHRDENSFTFFARGERFAIDPGYNPNKSRAHNTVLIDGKGQDSDKGEYDVNGKTKSFREYDSAWLITGEACDAFPESMQVSKARRQFLFVNADVPYLVIADEVRTKSKSTKYSWLFHTDPKHLIAIDQEKKTAFIKGKNRGAICRINFISPAEGLQITETNLKNDTFERNGANYRYSDFFKEIRAEYDADNARFITVVSAADTVKKLPRVRSKLQSGEIWLEVRAFRGRTDIIQVTPSRLILKTSKR